MRSEGVGDLVRVRFRKWEKNVGRSYAIAHSLQVLDEPTHRKDGRLRPTTRLNGRPIKRRVSIEDAARRKSAARARRTRKKEAPSCRS